MAREPQTMEEFTKNRKARSAAIAIGIVALVIFVYLVTVIRGPGLIADRPSYGVGGPIIEETDRKPAQTDTGASTGE